jgi:hypothetical protein
MSYPPARYRKYLENPRPRRVVARVALKQEDK